ncbi:MAG: hypothetical protein M1831_003485 [Alyxoria varia]|nr:MAG: hypothetical protein M1831_003485 [Alyxoria varia]
MSSKHVAGQPAAEIRLLGAYDSASQDKHAAPNTDIPQVMQVDLARSTVDEMRNFAKSSHRIELGFGKHAELRYGSETKRLRTRPSKYHHEVYESAPPSSEHGQAQSEWRVAGLVSHGFKIEKETSTRQDDAARSEAAAAKLKSKFNALDAAKDANRSTFSNEHILPPEGIKSKQFNKNAKMHAARKPANSLSSSPAYTGSISSSLQTSTRNFNSTTSNSTSISAVEGRRFVLLHLLAIGPISAEEIVARTGGTSEDINQLLDKIAEPAEKGNQWRLTTKKYKELDVWRFPYKREEDRRSAIDNAIHAFDKQRFNPSDEIWQKLLPKGERGKGRTLSKLKLFPNNHRELLGAKLNGKTASQPGSPDPSKMDKIDPTKNLSKVVKKKVTKDPKTGETKETKEPASKTKGNNAASKPKKEERQKPAAKGKPNPKSAEFVQDSDDDDSSYERQEKAKSEKAVTDKAEVGQKRRAEEGFETHVATGVNSSKKMKKDEQVAPKYGQSTKAPTNSKTNASPKAHQSSSGRSSSENTPLINAKRPKDTGNKNLGDPKASKQLPSATTQQNKPKSSQASEASNKGSHKRSSDSLEVDANSEQSIPAAKRKKLEDSSSRLSPRPPRSSASNSISPTKMVNVNGVSPKPKPGQSTADKAKSTSNLNSPNPREEKNRIPQKQQPVHATTDSQQSVSSKRSELPPTPKTVDKGRSKSQQTGSSSGAAQVAKAVLPQTSNKAADLRKSLFRELTNLHRKRFDLGWSTLALSKAEQLPLKECKERIQQLASQLDHLGGHDERVDEDYELNAMFSVKPAKEAKVFFQDLHNKIYDTYEVLEEQIENSQNPSESQKEKRATYEAELDDLRHLRKKAVEQTRKDAGDTIVKGVFEKEVPGTPLSRRQTIGQYRQYHKLLARYEEFKQESEGLESYPELPEDREKEDLQQFRRLAELLREIRAGFEDIMRDFNAPPTGEVKARGEREDEKCPVFTKHEAEVEYWKNSAQRMAWQKKRDDILRRLGDDATPEEFEELVESLNGMKMRWVQVFRAYALDFGAKKVGNYDDAELTKLEDPSIPFS